MAYADEIDLFQGPVTLTADFQYSNAYEIRSTSSIAIQAVYAPHAGSASETLNFIVQTSVDGTTWGDYGDWVHGADGAYTFRPADFTVDQDDGSPSLPVDDLRSRFMRVGVKAVGTTLTNFGSASMFAYVSNL